MKTISNINNPTADFIHECAFAIDSVHQKRRRMAKTRDGDDFDVEFIQIRKWINDISFEFFGAYPICRCLMVSATH